MFSYHLFTILKSLWTRLFIPPPLIILPDKISASLSYGCYRFCGSDLPPDLTSSGPVLSVVFVADEGVADSGFYASYQVISLSKSEYYMGCDYMLRLDSSFIGHWGADITIRIRNSMLCTTGEKIPDINEQHDIIMEQYKLLLPFIKLSVIMSINYRAL